MANKPEEKRRRRVRTLIQDSKKIINDFDQKGIKPKHEVISRLIGRMLDEIDLVKHYLDRYESSIEEGKEALPEQVKNDYLNMIKERKSDLKDLRECFSGLHRVYQHVGLNHR